MPQRIGRFIIREEIGRGSNGVVYSATDPVLGRDVAIKAIPLDPRQPGQRDVEAGFLQEAKIAAGLNHPSIVTVFDAGKNDAMAYIAMERLKGSDLHHWLSSNRPMSAEGAAALIARVADAVHFAHRRGLIHRDIKPSNIFLGRDMKPKVLDFGIALAQGKQGGADEARKLIGTPNYMSPEQALGRPLDARSDIFSIGAILYEMVAGQRAFDGADVDEILTKVVKTDPPPLSSVRPDISAVLGEIIFRALAKDPAQRYQTAGQLRNDLAAFAGRPVAPSTSPPGDLAITAPRGAGLHLPGPGALVATAIAIAGLALTFLFWYWSQGAEPESSSAVTGGPGVADTVPALAPAGGAGKVAPPAPPLPAATAASAPSEAAPVAPSRRASARARMVAEPAPAPPPPPAPLEPGTLSLAVAPWGEVFLDGGSVGVSPPLNRINLSPGTHSIELHNGSFPVYTVQVQIETGKTLLLQHQF
ncbi:putative Protein kinase [Burkholderiales bacterium]|nr:putative Protein kinase [Burkholderiales bacterium]